MIARNLPDAAGQRRQAEHARLRQAGRLRRRTTSRRASGSSAVSGPTPSTSTSAASSTWARCVRSTRRTSSRSPAMDGINSVEPYNVHTIALEIPIRELTRDRSAPPPTSMDAKSVIGVWATASRRKGRVYNEEKGKYINNGPWVQVSRLGNPLVNEVLIPMAEKDSWNAAPPSGGQGLRGPRLPARAGRAASGPLPGRVPEPGRLQQGPRRPARDPADRHPGRGVVPGLPELHGSGAVRHAAPQRGGAADGSG